ncbi:MAG TPA: PilZ domain-containing protein [Dehalococcoidia bacterium]
MALWSAAREPEGAQLRLVPGLRVLLQTVEGDALREHAAAVLAVEDGAFLVPAPAKGGRPWRSPGRHVAVHASQDGRDYVFDTEVLGLADGAPPRLRLAVPARVFPFERREYYRLPKVLRPAAAGVLDAAGNTARVLDPVVVDIGGGGLRFLEDRPVPAGSTVWLELPLTGPADAVHVQAEVVAARGPEPHEPRHSMSARFVGLSPADRQRILRFVFQQQVELRRSALG